MGHKEIILKYLKEKSNEDEVIALLQEQKKMLANPETNSILLNDEYLSVIIKLAKKSNRKIKDHVIIILSNVKYHMEAKNFYKMCRIEDECSNDKEGNIRQAGFILIKNLNTLMITLPLINRLQNASNADVNLFYESFRYLFIRLYFRFYNKHNQDIRKSILKSLDVMLPRFYDMAKFWNNEEEMSMANRIKGELNGGNYGNRN